MIVIALAVFAQLWCVPAESSGGSASAAATEVCQVKWFVMVLMVFPFATLFVPIFGLAAIANQSSPALRQVRVFLIECHEVVCAMFGSTAQSACVRLLLQVIARCFNTVVSGILE